jgi:hypothetical protein
MSADQGKREECRGPAVPNALQMPRERFHDIYDPLEIFGVFGHQQLLV